MHSAQQIDLCSTQRQWGVSALRPLHLTRHPACNPHAQSIRRLAAVAGQQQQSGVDGAAAAALGGSRSAPPQQLQPLQDPYQQQQLPIDANPQQLLGTLCATKSYAQLDAFVRSQAAAFLGTPLCVYALLHAVQLRNTLPSADDDADADDEQQQQAGGSGAWSLEQQRAAQAQFELVEQLLSALCDAAAQHAAALPLLSQATLALSLSQLGFFHAPLYEALSASIKQQLLTEPDEAPGAGGAAAAAAAAGAAARASDAAGSSDGGSSVAPQRAAVLAALPDASLAHGVLLSLGVAASMNGFYDPQLMDLLADQALAFRDTFPDADPLLSLASALLDLQHCAPDLLAAAAAAAVSSERAVRPEAAITLLLALSFFRVAAPEFVALALEGLCEAQEDVVALEPKHLARLWRALVLLAADGTPAPPELAHVLQFAAGQQQQLQQQQQGPGGPGGELLLLGSSRGALAALQDAHALDDAPDELRQQWEAAGLIAAVEVLAALQAQHGLVLQQGAEVPVAAAAAGGAGARAGSGGAHGAGFGQAQQQQQQQQQQLKQQRQLEQQLEQHQLPPGTVDVSFVLPDGRRVAVLVLYEDAYCSYPTNRLKGAAAVDVLVLQALGCAVLPLPVAEWRALGGDGARQQRYLAARLAAATG